MVFFLTDSQELQYKLKSLTRCLPLETKKLIKFLNSKSMKIYLQTVLLDVAFTQLVDVVTTLQITHLKLKEKMTKQVNLSCTERMTPVKLYKTA